MLKLTTCRNLRDIGGMVSHGGRAVARCRIYRGAVPFDHSDLRRRLGITRVIDLRAESELDAPMEACAGVERFHRPLIEDLTPWSKPFEMTPSNIGHRYFQMAYQNSRALRKVLKLLTTADQHPTLIHCVAGRDRTGIVVACALHLVGVADAAIADDYGRSSVMDDAEGPYAEKENILHFLNIARTEAGSLEEAFGIPATTVVALEAALLHP